MKGSSRLFRAKVSRSMLLESSSFCSEGLRSPVPIIVVFTRYDNLVVKKERQLHDSRTRTKDEIQSLAKSIAYQSFDKDCLMPMKKINSRVPCVCVSGEGSSQLLRFFP